MVACSSFFEWGIVGHAFGVTALGEHIIGKSRSVSRDGKKFLYFSPRMKCPAALIRALRSKPDLLLKGVSQDLCQLSCVQWDWISFEAAGFQGLVHSFGKLCLAHPKLCKSRDV